MRHNETLEWLDITASTAALALESAVVIGLRFAGAAAGGPNGAREAWRMWSEKGLALMQLQMRFYTGTLGSTPSSATKAMLKHYRRKVAANRKRLSR